MKIPYFCCIGAELKRYQKDFDFMNQVYLYKIPADDTLEEVLAQDYFQAIADTVLQDDLLYIYEPTAQALHMCRFNKQGGHITAVQLSNNVPGLTANRVLISDSTGHIAAGDVTLDYLKNKVNLDGTSTMTGPLKMRSSVSFKCAIAPSWDGVGFYKLNDNDSVTLMASMEATDGLSPAHNNTYNIGTTSRRWKDAYIGRVITAVLNNGYDIAVPVTNSADTLALKSQVDDAANSGEQLYSTGVWYAKMYSATVVPTGAEYNGKKYADFSQVDNDNNPIVVIYEGQSGSWVEIARITPPANHVAYLTITSKIWDIAEQTDQQGGEVLWSYNQKTFTPYPKIVSVDGLANTDLDNLTPTGEAKFTAKANTDMDNLTSTGQNIANWSSNVSNCITEIPQDIKLELNAGVLALKAGSKLYKPNGAGVFDTFVVETDLSCSTWGSGSSNLMVAFDTVNSTWGGFDIPNCYSGTTAPTGATNMLWYDTNNNIVKQTSNGGSTWNDGWTLPIFIISRSSGAITSIDQVFNGFGYIGSTVFVLPGVKGLTSNGRNADRTLNNTAFSVSAVQTVTSTTNGNNLSLFLDSNTDINGPTGSGVYNDESNYWTYSGTNRDWCEFARLSISSGKISLFAPKTVFRAVDYSDSEYIAHCAMPSNKYLSLTPGADGTEYIAPADGYFVLSASVTANSAICQIIGTNLYTSSSAAAGQPIRLFMPVSKGDAVKVYFYNATISTLKFVYANGAAGQ